MQRILSPESVYLMSVFFPAWETHAPDHATLNHYTLLKFIAKNKIINNFFTAAALEKFSPGFIRKLSNQRIRQKKRSLAQLAVLQDLGETLKNYEFLILKGLALSQEIYNDYAFRDNLDIDILVKPEEMVKIHHALLSNGYACNQQQNRLFAGPQHVHYHKRRVLIEVHWRTTALKNAGDQCHAELFANKREVEINRKTWFIPAKTITLLYLTSHGARHRWSRISWLLDIWNMEKNLSPKLINDAKTLMNKYDLAKHYDIYRKIIANDIRAFDFSSRVCLKELNDLIFHSNLRSRITRALYSALLNRRPMSMLKAIGGSGLRLIKKAGQE